ncbi:hypothetical protein [Agrococcus beijingensis]|uniref:hypothetical protein n=1 Tax=Agrococcus beijingensis TaxID=3068634 RepID=UPI0027403CA7|nr:hypothetical protein [Agrococcus sp. REN33]
MRTIVAGGIVAAAVLLLAGCASASPGTGSAAPDASDAPPAPTASAGLDVLTGPEQRARLADLPMPSAAGEVIAIGTALQNPDGPAMLCYVVATSLPPQCAGPELVGWDWAAVPHEEASGVRWSDAAVALRATYDATAFAITPLEVLDLAALSMPQRPAPTGDLDQATQTAVQEDLWSLQRPDVLGGGGDGAGIAIIEVVHDDGSMQAFLDDIYGPGAVAVVPWLL